MMDEQVVQLLRDQFKLVNEKIDSLQETMQQHVTQDSEYWKRIDETQGQINMLKWIAGSGFGSGMVAAFIWVYDKLTGGPH